MAGPHLLCGAIMRWLNISMDDQIAVLAVAEKGSFEAAGQYLGITKSAVRKRVQGVDSQLGTPVFHSTAKGMAPTEAGGIYILDARESVRHAQLGVERVHAFNRAQSRDLRIGYSSHLSEQLLDIIARLESYDAGPAPVERESLLTYQVVEKVVSGELDVGFGFLPHGGTELLTWRLMQEPLMVYLPAGHRLSTKHALALEDMQDESIIAVARRALPERHNEIVRHFESHGISLKFVADAYLPKEALWLVSKGIGIVFMARSSAPVLRSDIVLRPFSDNMLNVKSGLFVRHHRNTRVVDAFVQRALAATEVLRPKASRQRLQMPL